MTDQIRIDGGLVLERHQCQWERVLGQQPGTSYYRCALTWGDGTPCGTAAIDPMLTTHTQWIWKDEA
jgi:hypothetical protein